MLLPPPPLPLSGELCLRTAFSPDPSLLPLVRILPSSVLDLPSLVLMSLLVRLATRRFPGEKAAFGKARENEDSRADDESAPREADSGVSAGETGIYSFYSQRVCTGGDESRDWCGAPSSGERPDVLLANDLGNDRERSVPEVVKELGREEEVSAEGLGE